MPWDYRPWGCASGPKGSCNDGWIQFEICEDGLTNSKYFDLVYKEACELTAYLCKKYNINPNGTVSYGGVKIPTILCHADAHNLGFGSNHGDIYHWFPKYGKNMDTVRSDVSKLLNVEPEKTIIETNKETYRVRKSWEDIKSQVGAYTDLQNAKIACDKAGKEYEVYNSKGIAIYPTAAIEQIESKDGFKVGDEVSLIKDAVYSNGKAIPAWVTTYKMYVREI